MEVAEVVVEELMVLSSSPTPAGQAARSATAPTAEHRLQCCHLPARGSVSARRDIYRPGEETAAAVGWPPASAANRNKEICQLSAKPNQILTGLMIEHNPYVRQT